MPLACDKTIKNFPRHLFASGKFIDAVNKETTDDVDDDANSFILKFIYLFIYFGCNGMKSRPQHYNMFDNNYEMNMQTAFSATISLISKILFPRKRVKKRNIITETKS